LYREDFYFVDRFYGSAFHGSRCAASCEAHMNFADESAYLTADNVRNEGKFLPLFTDRRRFWKCCPSTRRYTSHRRKGFWLFASSLWIYSCSCSSIQGLLL
jgi:hypothetical protein